MPGVPQFPLSGGSLSKNVDLDRICLIENTVGNDQFPIGQYVFFTKNKSIWYRYKNISTPWTNDKLWVSNARESNVKFDANGYPLSTYIQNSDSAIHIKYFVAGQAVDKQISPLGRYPTVLIDTNDTYIFWVPVPYTTYLNFVQGCDDFFAVRFYNLTPPAPIVMMNMDFLPDNRWLFTFTLDGGAKNQVYTAYTDTIA